MTENNPHWYLVTGASSGIGFETALQISKDPGNRVIAIARNAAALQELKKLSGGRIESFVLDLEELQFTALVEHLVALGITSIKGILHNAGFLINKPFTEITSSDLEHTYRIQVFAPYLLTQALLPYLKKATGAHVVHMSSMGGVQGTVKFSGLSAYSSSKGALSILSECLAEELKADQIRVNCLAIGAVNTPMLQQAFPGYEAPLEAAQMAEFTSWFLTKGSTFFNGKIVPVAISTP